MNSYDRHCARLLDLIYGEMLPSLMSDPEQTVTMVVCQHTVMTPDAWLTLSERDRIPWLQQAITALQQTSIQNIEQAPELAQEATQASPAPEQSTPAPVELPCIWWHGERAYSTDKENPQTVSREQDSLLQAYLDRVISLDTKQLKEKAENPSKIIKILMNKFPNGAIIKLDGKGAGYRIRVRTLEK